ncbi:MAG TPA: T9SS type A sorting domain-containing protein [bacterium]|jgi:hypothetical protein
MKSLTMALMAVLSLSAAIQAQPDSLHLIWSRVGAADSSRYGYALLPLGDQNNDGFDDWAVLSAGAGHDTSQCHLEFFHGGNPPSMLPYLTQQGIFAHWGQVGDLGDVNGDGYTDWFIKLYDTTGFFRVNVYLGGPNADTTAALTWRIPWADYFGTVGDFNGDGYSDLYWYHYFADALDVFYGGNPPDIMPNWTHRSPVGQPQQVIPLSFGDLNGDHCADFVGYSYLTDAAYIFVGGAHPDTVPAYTWPNMLYPPRGIVKDLNGDGSDELIVTTIGGAEIHFGGPVLHSTPDVTVNFPCSSGATEVISAGDFNHDRYQDFVQIRSYCDNSPNGILSLYLGHPWIYSEPAFSIYGDSPPFNLISVQTAANLGDVNGDSIDDLGIGAWDDLAYVGWRGRALILRGDSAWRADAAQPHAAIPQLLQVIVYPNPFNSEANIALQVPPSAREVTLTLYNVLGQVAFQTTLPAFGEALTYHFDSQRTATPLTTGVYFLRAEAGAAQTTQKLMVLR